MEEEEKKKISDGKRRTSPPSLPANYISIIQLQERWLKEKDRKQKEEEEETRRRKQQIEEDKRRIVEEDHDDLYENRLNRKKNSSGNRKKKEESDAAVTAEIGSEGGVNAAAEIDNGSSEKKKRGYRKRYDSRKNKKYKDAVVDVEEEVVIECGSIVPPEIGSERGVNAAAEIENGSSEKKKKRGYRKRYDSRKNKKYKDVVVAVEEEVIVECGSIVPPENNNTPAKKESKPKGRFVYREKAVVSQFQDLSINEDEESGNQRSRPNPRRRVKTPRETVTMVWVKKGDNERASQGIENVVKPQRFA